MDERRRGTPTLDLLGVLIEWGGKRRANRLSEAQDCPQKQEQVARDVNAQRHTNILRSHPLHRLYLDFTLVCVLQKNAAATGLLLLYQHYYRCYYYRCCCYCCCYHYDSNSWLASSDIDRYFQLVLCPFSRPLLRTCSRVHKTICTVFNVIFQSRPLLLSRFPFRSSVRLFVSLRRSLSCVKEKTKYSKRKRIEFLYDWVVFSFSWTFPLFAQRVKYITCIFIRIVHTIIIVQCR